MTNADKYEITKEEYEIILALRELQNDVKDLKESGEIDYDKQR